MIYFIKTLYRKQHLKNLLNPNLTFNTHWQKDKVGRYSNTDSQKWGANETESFLDATFLETPLTKQSQEIRIGLIRLS